MDVGTEPTTSCKRKTKSEIKCPPGCKEAHTDSECSTKPTRRWMMLILVTCVCIIRRCRQTGINTLNVLVWELECYQQLKLEKE